MVAPQNLMRKLERDQKEIISGNSTQVIDFIDTAFKPLQYHIRYIIDLSVEVNFHFWHPVVSYVFIHKVEIRATYFDCVDPEFIQSFPRDLRLRINNFAPIAISSYSLICYPSSTRPKCKHRASGAWKFSTLPHESQKVGDTKFWKHDRLTSVTTQGHIAPTW